MNRLIAVILGIAFIFAVIIDVLVVTGDGSIRWGIFILYLLGTALLGYGTLFFWRRAGGTTPAV
ncbi:MAG: hypothetical protein JWM73_2941 [Solirubrobacterales bacterium]|jgi:hypothetical protein|nr:hypothetical protein [Solirubrobacterales bacterium]